MKKLILIFILFITTFSFGQNEISSLELEKNNLLSADAYFVFETNKYLDFKNKDSLHEIINNRIYKKVDLNNYFGYKQNWKNIENETFKDYKQEGEKFDYTYHNNTMTETYLYFGSFNVWREIKTVYNDKGFVLSRYEKIYIGDHHTETRIVINEFDDKSRVTKITKRDNYVRTKENNETTINVRYKDNIIDITSENGTIACKFITDPKAIGFISTLSPKRTTDYFRNSIEQHKFDNAKEHCTEKMIQKCNASFFNQKFTEIIASGARQTFGEKEVNIYEDWEIKFADKSGKRSVIYNLIKQKNGWKIDDFKITD